MSKKGQKKSCNGQTVKRIYKLLNFVYYCVNLKNLSLNVSEYNKNLHYIIKKNT